MTIMMMVMYVSAAEMLSAEKIKKEPTDDETGLRLGKLICVCGHCTRISARDHPCPHACVCMTRFRAARLTRLI